MQIHTYVQTHTHTKPFQLCKQVLTVKQCINICSHPTSINTHYNYTIQNDVHLLLPLQVRDFELYTISFTSWSIFFFRVSFNTSLSVLYGIIKYHLSPIYHIKVHSNQSNSFNGHNVIKVCLQASSMPW